MTVRCRIHIDFKCSRLANRAWLSYIFPNIDPILEALFYIDLKGQPCGCYWLKTT
jgi:hypothetical protein